MNIDITFCWTGVISIFWNEELLQFLKIWDGYLINGQLVWCECILKWVLYMILFLIINAEEIEDIFQSKPDKEKSMILKTSELITPSKITTCC